MSISVPLIKWSINFRDLNFYNIILDILVTFLTPKKEEYFIRVEIHW